MFDQSQRIWTAAGASNRARCLVLGWILLAFASTAHAGDVTVVLSDSSHSCEVQGEFAVPVAREVAWAVLSDYDHIADFVTSMVSSRAERGRDGSLRVHQEATGRAMMLTRRVHVVLETREESFKRIAFTDVLAKDFTSYAGEWLIVPMPESTSVYVTYHLAAEPKGTMARLFCRGVMRKTAQELLEQVRAEMLRRDASAQTLRRGPKGS